MRSTWFTRAGRAALAGAMLVALIGVESASAKPAPGRPAKRSGLNLFALTFGVMNVNRIFCGINNIGEVCVDPTNSPVVGGGFWPKGTPDQYIFNSGLQLAGTIPSSAGFSWAGDTVGAYFMDPRGDQAEGDPLTLVYNSLDASDAANWPNGAVVRDTAIYNSVLIGRNNISQEDLWVRTWDGNPAFTGGVRTHPMGVLVEERGLAWNFPTGNEDIIYFVYNFYNVTAKNAAVYANLDPAIQSEIAAVGANFQSLNEAKYNLNIPDDGYPITNMFAAFFADMDVGNASFNYSTPVIPFAMGVAYKSDFLEPTWEFPADIFGAPFVPSPGFIGVKYLRSPINPTTGQQIGLTIFSNTLNSGTGYPDPVGIKQLYRYLSGGSSPAAGDNPCTFQGKQLELHFCYVAQNAADTRFFQSSGPLTLNPGEVQSIVVAYVNGAPVGTADVLASIGGDFKPGIPSSGDSIYADPTRVRPIERAMGWVSQTDRDSNQTISQDEVQTVPRSLLNKALVAQAVYDNKFLLPFAPEPPTFFLVPGDNQVTVAWQKSETETVKPEGGDPFFAIASDPTSKLYDPNFRQYDVEGYRIYRGRSTSRLDLVAQFDYTGTSIVDYTGDFAYTEDIGTTPADRNNPPPGDTLPDGIVACAPELGIQDDCPDTDPNTPGRQVFPAVPNPGLFVEHSLVGNVIQVPAGGRVELANGGILILKADTAVTGEGSGYPALSDNGVTFAYVDRGVRNLFSYYYAVTAFDVNSVTSGPSSIESPRVTKQATPRAAGSNATQAVLVQGEYGADGTLLDPTAQYPTIDPDKGTFNGNMPPANDAALILASAVVEALPAGDISVTVDSVSAGFTGGIGLQPVLHLTLSAAGTTIERSLSIDQPNFNASGDLTYSFDEALVPYDSAGAQRFGIAFTQDVRMPITYGGKTVAMTHNSNGVATISGRYGVGTVGSRYLAHSRWFDGGGAETQKDPTIVAYADSFHNSGHLTGVGRIWSPQTYRDMWPDNTAGPSGYAPINLNFRGYTYAGAPWYQGDFLVTWNADSSITVFDSSNHGELPFNPDGGSGWGFLNLRSLQNAGITVGDLADGTGTPALANVTYHHLYATRALCYPDWWDITCADLEQKAQFEPLDFNYDGAADANGIVLMVNSEVYFMELSQIPAAGTTWRLRAVSGTEAATCVLNGTPPGGAAYGPDMASCSGYSYTGYGTRPSYAPGLNYKITVQARYAVDQSTSGDLSRVHTVPDPYYVTNALEATANTKVLKFVNLPNRAIIRIYSLSGVLVQVLTHNDQGGSGEATWNLRNRNNQFVASGVYFYHVEGPDGQTKVGRFTVVNFAP
jgi:hypothetical protein